MRMKRLSSLILVVMLMLAMSTTALASMGGDADRVPDYSKEGSITADILTPSGDAVPGGTLSAYLVALATEDNGNHKLVYADAFVACDLSLDRIEQEAAGAPELAAALAKYADEQGLTGMATEIGRDGRAVFSGLKLGLYLIIQDVAAEGYETINPFLITVPMWDGEKMLYDVYANPKPESATALGRADITFEKAVKTEKDSQKAPEDAKFTFRMIPADPDYPVPACPEATIDRSTGALTLVTRGPGSYSFGEIFFSSEDVGKTYTYTVHEVKGNDPNYTYDTTVYTLRLTIEKIQETGEISVKKTCADNNGKTVNQLAFLNTYDKQPETPHTGQLWWPVPVMAVGGLMLFAIGWIIRTREKQRDD